MLLPSGILFTSFVKMKFKKITGKFIYIVEKDFPLNELTNFFSIHELKYIFGNDIINPVYFDEIENDVWSTHLIFKRIQSNKFSGYLRIISVKNIVEIHGGGINTTFIDKIALSEAWLLIIKRCFEYYQTKTILTSCMIENLKAYKLITGSGFMETSRNLKENRINFTLLYDDFINNRKFKSLK